MTTYGTRNIWLHSVGSFPVIAAGRRQVQPSPDVLGDGMVWANIPLIRVEVGERMLHICQGFPAKTITQRHNIMVLCFFFTIDHSVQAITPRGVRAGRVSEGGKVLHPVTSPSIGCRVRWCAVQVSRHVGVCRRFLRSEKVCA